MELNGREYNLILEALKIATNHITGVLAPLSLSGDEAKMLVEEHESLIERFEKHLETKGAGVYIDGVRQ